MSEGCENRLDEPNSAQTAEMNFQAEPLWDSGHPGIYYENLALSMEVYEEEHRKKKEPLFSGGERLGLFGGLLLLVAFLGMIWGFSRSYDPHASAIVGKSGIRVDNLTFGIYCQDAMSQYAAQNESLPFFADEPLEKQYYNLEEGYTWADYFMSRAFEAAAVTASVSEEARSQGMELSERMEQQYQNAVDSLGQAAAASGLREEQYLQRRYGEDMTLDCYLSYLYDSCLAETYADALYESFGGFDDETLEAYYQAHKSDFADLELSDIPNVDVRHILLIPEDESQEARDALEEYAASTGMELMAFGNPEESFIQWAQEESRDSGSRSSGGLLENLYPGQVSWEFSQWCFDPAGHEPGDLGIAWSSYGLHVIRFQGYRENYHWKEVLTDDLRQKQLSEALSQICLDAGCKMTRFAAISPRA